MPNADPTPLWCLMLAPPPPVQDKEVFTDTTSMPIIRKKIRKVERQGEMESKRKWQMVTRALLADDVEAASAAKHEVRGWEGV